MSKTMNNEKEKGKMDFYAVLGLKKECTTTDLRTAYRKLAMRWHPDRCSSSGNLKYVEQAKRKFQAIQEAYSVLSDDDKRFLYDIGLYNDDDNENEMGDFMSEMAVMMSQNKDSRNGSLEDLQELFADMFESDLVAFSSSSNISNHYPSSSSYSSYGESLNATQKRKSNEMNNEKSHGSGSSFDAQLEEFCPGMGGTSRKWQDGGKKNDRSSRSRRK